jgi:hypothetical protein
MKVDDRILTWLASKGLELELVEHLNDDAFVPGVWFDAGKLVVNPNVALAEDVLHEAGHLACIPSKFRGLTVPGSLPGPKLEAAVKEYCDTHPLMDEHGQEDQTWRNIMQMGDCEATAWAYAAGRRLELTAEQLFVMREDGTEAYDGDGPDLWTSLDMNSYFGINGLQAAGFCQVRTFPRMARWLAP